jgi:hypothetical protein
MKTTRPRGFDTRLARSLLAKVKPHRTVAARVEALSALLLGAPYEANGLVGSAETPEVFVAPLDRFDCVTYVESVYALARAADPAGFLEELRKIRYEDGVVEWSRRNHYMTDWLRRNGKAGVVWPVAAEGLGVRKERLLNVVPGLGEKKVNLYPVPKAKLRAYVPRLRNGDLLLFVSTKAGLDVFHCGLLVLSGGGLKLRHASRSAGRVVEQELSAFLRANAMAGLLASRPQETTGAA